VIFKYFSKTCREKIKFHYNRKVIKVTLHKDKYTFSIISRSVLLRIQIFQANFVDKLETQILCSVIFFYKNLTFYETNVEKYCRGRQGPR